MRLFGLEWSGGRASARDRFDFVAWLERSDSRVRSLQMRTRFPAVTLLQPSYPHFKSFA